MDNCDFWVITVSLLIISVFRWTVRTFWFLSDRFSAFSLLTCLLLTCPKPQGYSKQGVRTGILCFRPATVLPRNVIPQRKPSNNYFRHKFKHTSVIERKLHCSCITYWAIYGIALLLPLGKQTIGQNWGNRPKVIGSYVSGACAGPLYCSRALGGYRRRLWNSWFYC